jgi:hypothetical protein
MSDENFWGSATFRVLSKTLSSERIAAEFETLPTTIARKGEPVSKRSTSAGARTDSLCSYQSPHSDTSPLQDHLGWVVAFCADHASAIRRLAGECTFDVWIGYGSEHGQGGFVLPSANLAILGELGIDLFVDLYAPTDR